MDIRRYFQSSRSETLTVAAISLVDKTSENENLMENRTQNLLVSGIASTISEATNSN